MRACACVRAVRARGRACLRACVRTCVRVCMRACEGANVATLANFYFFMHWIVNK